MRRAAITVALSFACATAVAACGGSKPAAHRLTGSSRQYAAARCMRAHGVQSFPDPDSYGGSTVSMTPGSDVITIAGISFSGPAFRTAEKLCNPLGLAGPRPAISERQKQQLVAFAECMRRHGLKQWADPIFPAAGGIEQVGESAYSRDDPKVLTASADCNRAR
jgi:hypothetical protein